MNLSRQPFVNELPVYRLTAALWALGAVLLLVNGVLYWRHFSGSQSTGARLVEAEREIERERATIDALRAELEALDLTAQNREARWVNARIAARTFSWSTLFDRIGEVLPEGVRLSSLSPRFYRDEQRRMGLGRTEIADVELSLRGAARSDAELLELMDRLFAHRCFLAPNLAGETRREGGQIEFSLSVVYRSEPAGGPSAAQAAGEAPIADATGGES